MSAPTSAGFELGWATTQHAHCPWCDRIVTVIAGRLARHGDMTQECEGGRRAVELGEEE